MEPVRPPGTEPEAEQASRALEERVEALAGLAWTTSHDVARAVSMARKCAALASSEGASRRGRALGAVARVRLAMLESDLDAVVRLGTSALESLHATEDAVWQCRVLGDVAVAMSMQGRLDDAQPLYERGRELAQTQGLQREEFRILYNFAELHMSAGRTNRALTLLQEARALAIRMGDRSLEGLALENEGNLYRILGAYPEATSCLLGAIEILKRLNEQAHIAIAYYDLAAVYSLTGMHEQAIAAANEAVDRLESGPETIHLANALTTVGFVHRKAGDLDAALDAMERGLAMRERLGLQGDAAGSILMLGETYLEAGRLREAEARFKEGFSRAAHLDVPRVSLGCRAGLAAVLQALDRAEEALKLAQPLIRAWEEIGDKENLADVHDLVAELHEATGDNAAALASLKRARVMRDELLNRETTARLQHLQITHEVAREREKAAEALGMLSRRVMESQEEERRRVARDLHDDLNPRLALLAVELDVLARAPPASKEGTQERFSTLADSVRLIEEQLYRISHSLHPATLEQLGLVGATRSVCEEIGAAYDVDIRVQAEAWSGPLTDDVELGMFRIFQEALQNAVRHSEANFISVRLFENANGICLQVRDDGVGFDPHALEDQGIGLVAMRERAQHLGGRLEVRSAPKRGTVVELCVARSTEGV